MSTLTHWHLIELINIASDNGLMPSATETNVWSHFLNQCWHIICYIPETYFIIIIRVILNKKRKNFLSRKNIWNIHMQMALLFFQTLNVLKLAVKICLSHFSWLISTNFPIWNIQFLLKEILQVEVRFFCLFCIFPRKYLQVNPSVASLMSAGLTTTQTQDIFSLADTAWNIPNTHVSAYCG